MEKSLTWLSSWRKSTPSRSDTPLKLQIRISNSFKGNPLAYQKKACKIEASGKTPFLKYFILKRKSCNKFQSFIFVRPCPHPSLQNETRARPTPEQIFYIFLHICYYMHLFLITFFRTYSALFVYLF